MKKKITVPEIRETKTNGRKICLVTCYDYTSATLVEKSDVEMILIGDSLGMTMLGFDGTIGVQPEDTIRLGAAVRRGAPTTFIIGDMPFGSYNVSDEQAVQTANRLMIGIGCDAIKLEGDKASVNGKSYDFSVKEGIEQAASASSGSGEEIKAGVPGNVLRIEATEGTEVQEGDVIMVLEAMKMEIEVKSTKAGTVQSILVAQGDKVVTGQALAIVG